MEEADGGFWRTGSVQEGARCENLASYSGFSDMDTLMNSDPMCVLFYKHYGQWREVRQTGAIRNTLNLKNLV
ncbi:hypothetical protein MAR_017721 [Mya arenaria]|uniref:Uncharacterized protein n=1 Tax=Mya arenaria TaxID=6604 RepID=A0ABY7EGH3_MYAAR|nr:hypothetical protein MAR_017721 [Mya arenaria]